MLKSNELIVALSWKIVSEFMRCFPGKFKIIETHPGGGQYDCLSILDRANTAIAHLNRKGGLTINHAIDPSTFRATQSNDHEVNIWGWFLTDDRSIEEQLSHLLNLLNLKLPTPRPPSTPEILTYRFISNVLNYTLFSGNRWDCRNGYWDSAADDGDVVADYFDKFEDPKNRLQIKLHNDVLGKPAYRFWFLMKERVPIACIETCRTIWTLDGKSFDLMDLYQRDRRIWNLINNTIGKLLP